MRYWTVTLIAVAAFAACTYLFCEKLTLLLDVGTCASGNQPFVVARECPEGTEGDGLLLGGSVVGILLAGILLVFRGPRPEGSRAMGIGWMALAGWALFFTITGIVSLVHSLTSDLIGPDGKTGGLVVAVTFLLMGLPVLLFVVAGLTARVRGRDETPAFPYSSSRIANRAATSLFGSMKPAQPADSSRFATASASPASSTDEQLEQLERLQRLRESGALTESEFETQKARVLGGR